MALTAVEQVQVRRFCGYGVAQATPDLLDAIMAGLSPEQETVIRTAFLPSLAVLELALTATSDNLDTASAAVWTRNPAELAERSVLYRGQRLALCRFLGVDIGLAILDPVMIVPDACGCGTAGSGGGIGGGAGLSAIPAVFVV